MAAQVPTRAGQGNCVRWRTIPRHERAQRGRAHRLGGVGRVKPGGGDGVAQAEGTAAGGKVGVLYLRHARKREGGRKGLLANGRGGSPVRPERGGGTLSPLCLLHARKGVAGV